jgi:alkylated DNA repair dioxygenase AlkB
MNSDLFVSDSSFELLPLDDAEVLLLRQINLPRPAPTLLEELIRETPWRREEITVWGKTHLQPRLIAWYGDEGRNYTYSGISMNPLPWTQTLSELKAIVESTCNEKFNSVLLNYYRDGRDSIGFHSDDEPELGPRPTIASLSLGESRVFSFKRKGRPDAKIVNIELTSGSLLLMKGDTQRNWKHGIAKSSRPLGPRVNLTFRKIEPPNSTRAACDNPGGR